MAQPSTQKVADIPGLGSISMGLGFVPLSACRDGRFRAGRDGVVSITATGDRKVEFIAFADHTLAYVTSSLGYPAYYPVLAVEQERPIRAVLMDLDGTTARIEEFWIWIIELTVAELLGDSNFHLADDDRPLVSGHSVSEHLQYCLDKYCRDATIEQARRCYVGIVSREMKAIAEGRGRADAFTPAPGLKRFLLELKSMGVQIALVTSGLYEKARPEIVSVFRTLNLGDPCRFYDAIITAGQAIHKGCPGTMGELAPKPHPWLYAEACRVGLGLDFAQRGGVIGVEDSGAGVCSIRLAGFTPIGLAGGNIVESGTRGLCRHHCDSFAEILTLIR